LRAVVAFGADVFHGGCATRELRRERSSRRPP
jgi:hypothetical protein